MNRGIEPEEALGALRMAHVDVEDAGINLMMAIKGLNAAGQKDTLERMDLTEMAIQLANIAGRLALQHKCWARRLEQGAA